MRLTTLRTERGLRAAFATELGGVALESLQGASTALTDAIEIGARMSDGGIVTLLDGWNELRPELLRLADVAEKQVARGSTQPAATDTFGPSLPRPRKIIGVGLNYLDHAAETGQAAPSAPVLFAKFPTSVIASGDAIVRPAGVIDLDYEAELGVVVGAVARDVPLERALEVVAGYTCGNDVSARAAQAENGQWVRGKSFDTFCPLGPAIVDAADAGDPQQLSIRLSVDGDERQRSNTRQMIFGVAELISYLSRCFTLEPGDLILTGTPAGVALGREPHPWLQPGQTVTVEIEGLGRLQNRVIDARGPAS